MQCRARSRAADFQPSAYRARSANPVAFADSADSYWEYSSTQASVGAGRGHDEFRRFILHEIFQEFFHRFGVCVELHHMLDQRAGLFMRERLKVGKEGSWCGDVRFGADIEATMNRVVLLAETVATRNW